MNLSEIKRNRSIDYYAQVNLARRQGMAVTTETKYGAGGNTQVLSCEVLQNTKLNYGHILERNELKHCKAGSRD